MVVNITTKNYAFGLVNIIEPQSIKRGAASASLNWLTMGDHIELRRGSAFLGTSSVNTGNGKTTGLRKVTNSLGVEILYGTYGKKLRYYKTATGEWAETGSDLLGSAVVDASGYGNEGISLEEYVTPAGNQLWVNSPNCAGYFKILVANPGTALDHYDAAKNFKGDIKIDTNRTLLWGRTKDKTGVYGSYIDSQTYTTVTAESVGTGDGATKHFTATLAAVSTTPRTAFGLTVTAGAITLTDDYAGGLSASDGSTGTINYITGALVVDFATAPVNLAAITTTYQWESAKAGGIADFTKSGTRTAGQGFVFRQDEGGGPVKNINTFSTVYYCMHVKKTWALTIGADDTTATNLPYRDRVGIPTRRGSIETGDGVIYVDDQNPDDVKIRILSYGRTGSEQVIPVPISGNLNLNAYLFDQAATIEWGEYRLIACRQESSPVNNAVLVYNKNWKSWDVLDWNVNCFEIFEGGLVAGDAISNNFLQLFSGYDDLGDFIANNYWEGRLDDLDVEGLKKTKKFYLNGLIAQDQALEVYLSIDNGDPVLVGTIEGNGDYVDRNNPITIGSVTLGRKVIGSTGTGAVTAYPYELLMPVRLDKFEQIKVRYVATKIGYVSVSEQKYWDVRSKGIRVPRQYRPAVT